MHRSCGLNNRSFFSWKNSPCCRFGQQGLSLLLLPVVRDAARQRPCDFVAVLGKEADVVAVDEACLHEDGGHGGIAQDAETWMRLDAAIGVAAVDGRETFYELALDAVGERFAVAAEGIAVGFRTSAAARVDVDGHEQVGGPAVGGVDDAGIARRFAVEVVTLQQLYFQARGLEVFAAEAAVGNGKVAFAQVVAGIDAAGVGIAAEGVTGI